MTHADPPLTAPRRAAIVFGHLCLLAAGLLFARIPFSMLLALFFGGGLLFCLGHGSRRGPRPSRRQRWITFGGMGALLLLTSPASGYREAARASAWLPRQPGILWLAGCPATFDFLRLLRTPAPKNALQRTTTGV